MFNEEQLKLERRRNVRWAVLLYGVMLFVAWGMRAAYTGEIFYVDDLGIPPWGPMLVAVLGSLAVLAVSPRMERWQWVHKIARTVREVFGPLPVRRAALLGTASGTAEEALFRGALQLMLGPYIATVLFAILHGFGWWGLFALIMGAGLAALYAWGDNLWPCIVAHVLINSVNLRRISYSHVEPEARRDSSPVAG